MTTEHIKKCVFCYQSESSIEAFDDFEKFYVSCGYCGACGPWQHTKENAIQAWNTLQFIEEPKA